MAAAPSATGYLKLDINGFQEAISSAKRLLGTLAGAFVAFKTAEFFKNGIKGAIDFGHEIHQASMRMGQMDPGNLLIAQKVLERMGLGADEARGQLEQMVESGKPLAGMFKSAEDYGKAIATAKQDYGSQAAILSKSAKDFNAVYYAISAIGEKTKTLFMAATSGFVKPLYGVLNMLRKNDFSKQAEAFGKKIGEGIATLTQLFKDGKLWEYVKTGMQVAFLKSIEALKSGLSTIGLSVMDSLSGMGEAISSGLLTVYEAIGGISADVIVAIGEAGYKLYEAIHGAVDFLEQAFRDAFSIAMKAFNFILEKAKDIWGTITDAVSILAAGVWDAISNIQAFSAELINSAIMFSSKLLDGALDAISNIGKWMAEAFTGSVEFLKEALDKVFSNNWFQLIGNRFKALFSGFGSIIAEKMGADNVAEEYRNAAIAYDEAANVNLEVVKADIAKFFSNFAGKTKPIGADGQPVETETASEKRIRQLMEQMEKLTGGKRGDQEIDYGPEGMRSSLGAGSGPWSVIADSLASIGGGGGYMTSSLSPEAREAMKANQQLKVIGDQLIESNKTLAEIKNAPPAKGGKLLMKK